MCKFGASCKKSDCTFEHDCRFGLKCNNIDKCRFNHHCKCKDPDCTNLHPVTVREPARDTTPSEKFNDETVSWGDASDQELVEQKETTVPVVRTKNTLEDVAAKNAAYLLKFITKNPKLRKEIIAHQEGYVELLVAHIAQLKNLDAALAKGNK